MGPTECSINYRKVRVHYNLKHNDRKLLLLIFGKFYIMHFSFAFTIAITLVGKIYLNSVSVSFKLRIYILICLSDIVTIIWYGIMK